MINQDSWEWRSPSILSSRSSSLLDVQVQTPVPTNPPGWTNSHKLTESPPTTIIGQLVSNSKKDPRKCVTPSKTKEALVHLVGDVLDWRIMIIFCSWLKWFIFSRFTVHPWCGRSMFFLWSPASHQRVVWMGTPVELLPVSCKRRILACHGCWVRGT